MRSRPSGDGLEINMYNIADRNSVVKEIKKYLYFVAEYAYPEIPKTTIDSKYDAETANSVRGFQRAVGLKETGEVNLATFNLLYAEYKRVKDDKTTADYIITDAGFPIMPGDISEDVRAIHAVINELAQIHTEIEGVGNSNYYSKRTENAVYDLRKIFMMNDAPFIDKILYFRMLEELSAHKRNKNTADLKN